MKNKLSSVILIALGLLTFSGGSAVSNVAAQTGDTLVQTPSTTPFPEFTRSGPPTGTGQQLAAASGGVAEHNVFHPVVPCRIVDTRNSGGIMTPGTSRDFRTIAVEYFTQGGANSNCGTTGVGRISAIHVNITTTQAVGGGWLQAYPYGASVPNASVSNYSAGDDEANALTIPISYGSFNDFTIRNEAGSTHVIIDIMGYEQPEIWADVNGSGAIVLGSRYSSSTKLGPGLYEVMFDRDITSCRITSSQASGSVLVATVAHDYRTGNTGGVFVQITSTGGAFVDAAFTVRVDC